jgi:sugar (pentulose or hexulose) kinase
MTGEATAAESGPLVDVDDARLLAPADMEEALLGALGDSGQGEPAGRGQLVRCVLESLALEYAWGLDTIGRRTGKRPEALYIVGGGIHNKLLCQLTASACGVVVHAGADQCTALGILKSRDEIRDVMRASSAIATYEPQDEALWAGKREQYTKLQGTKSWG